MPRLNFLVRLVFCLATILLPLKALDQWFYDRLFRLRGQRHSPSNFMLVTINDSKLYQQFSSNHPPGKARDAILWDSHQSLWYVSFYTELLRKIGGDGPQLVLFTPFFGWTDMDRSLLPAPLPFPVLFSARINREGKLIPPPEPLAQRGAYGFNNLFVDSDNIVRQYRLVYSSGASLALRTRQTLNPAPIQRDLIEPLWIDFRGPSHSYQTVDAWDLFETHAPNAETPLFRNKIVLVGREGNSALDLETPFGKMSELEIQANAIDTFLDERDIRIVPRSITLSTTFVAVLISVLIILIFPLTLSWLLLVLFSTLLVLVALFIFSTIQLWIGVANPLASILGTHLLMLGYKLSRQEAEQWKIQQESEYLKELDQFKNNFISLFSHDLKTPISKIKAITDRLLTDESNLSQPLREGLLTIDRTNSELSRSISDILKVTKMEAMAIEPTRGVIDLNRLVEGAVQRLKFLSDEKGIVIILDLEPLFSMEGDQQLIEEVLLNLLENSIKHSPPGKKIILRTREETEQVRVSVIDEGAGIPPDELPRVTGKFYRGKAVQHTTKGSGLGLYLAKYFVELHRGRLEILSEEGKGTEVSFYLPIKS